MSSRLFVVAAAAAGLVLAIGMPVLAHGDEEAPTILVEPVQVNAGGTIVLAGDGLEPQSVRVIDLVGSDVVVPFGAVTTDAEGMFSVTLTVPGHLPAGAYTFEAIGDETVTVSLDVTAGPAAVEPGAGRSQASPQPVAAVETTPRSRSGLELGVLALIVIVLIGCGAVLAVRAERIGRAL